MVSLSQSSVFLGFSHLTILADYVGGYSFSDLRWSASLAYGIVITALYRIRGYRGILATSNAIWLSFPQSEGSRLGAVKC